MACCLLMQHVIMKIIASLLLFAAACTTTPSGAACPTDNAPSYDSFGKTFMTTYCTGCHSRTAENRHGAPTEQNYDSEDDIRAHATDIDGVAAAGPNAKNT